MITTSYDSSKRFLLRFVISYSAVLLLFLVMSFYIYYAAIDKTRDNVYQQNIYLLENGVEEMDSTFRLIDTLATQIYSSTDIRKLLYMTERNTEFYLQAESAIEYLHEIMSLENALPIEAYYIYLPLTDKLLSSNYFIDPLLYYNHEMRFDRESYDQWYEMLTSSDNFRKLIPLDIYKEKTNFYWYKLPVSSYYANRDPLGYICMEFNIGDFKEVFNNLSFTKGSSLLVTDSENKALYSLLSDAGDAYNPTEIVSSSLELFTEGNVWQTKFEGESYNIIYCQSDYNQLNFYYVQPSSYMLEDFYRYQKLYILVILATFFLTLGTIYLISKRNVQPIIQINNQLEDSKQENQTLLITLNQQRPFVVNACLGRLLRGTFTQDELAEIYQCLNFSTEPSAYSVLCVKVIPDLPEAVAEEEAILQEDQAFDEQKMLLPDTREYLYQTFRAYFGDDIFIYLQDTNSFAIIFHYRLEDDYDEFCGIVSEKFVQMHEMLQTEHSLLIFGGLGKRNRRITYLWQSFHQAMEALTYTRESHVMQVHCQIQKKSNSYYYPTELAEQLTRFIHAGNSQQTMEIFKILRRENFEYRRISINITKWLLTDIRNTLAKFRFTIEKDQKNEDILTQVDYNFQQQESMELLERTALMLCTLYTQNVEGNKLITHVQLYVKENYTDPSLGLSMISEKFGISESYFSYLFKAETMQNFSDYLEMLRMEHAIRLIKHTEEPLSEIYLKVGYNNANSFRRAFKKVHGASPKVFRSTIS